MGEVYLAQDTKLQRSVAIKALTGATEESSSSRLLNEARAACALSHPNICTVYEVLERGDQSFLVMEHVKGHALSTLIPRGGQPIETVLHYGSQIADAVAHAHERGIVHRDLKPSNVMITPDGRAKVLDFGIAARRPATGWDDITQSRDSFVRADRLAGTLAYMAPELLRGKSADARSDIWAFGVLLYEMATGALPFRGQSGFDLTAAILTDQPVALPAHVPGTLATTILHCLAKQPERRYQRAGEVRAALETIQSGSSAPVTEPLHTWRRVRPWAAALLLMTFVAAGLGIWKFSRASTPPSGSLAPREPVVVLVADFENRVGDPIFDLTVAQALTIALEDSLVITPYTRLDARRASRSLSGVTQGGALDEPLARLIAVREGIRVLVAGSVDTAQVGYTISLRLVDPVLSERTG
jgi:serine/threonine protein kinase